MEHIGKVFQQDQKMAERTAAIETRRREYEGILRRQRAEELFKASGCPERQANIGKIDPGSKWQASLELLSGQLRFANGFIVAILGQRGTGKTQLAIALVRRACAAQLRCRYIKASDLFRSIRSTYGRSDKQETEEEVFNRWVSYDLLVIDESHERGETPAENQALINIVDRRYDARRCTVFIANQDKAAFAQSMGASITSRIHECGEAIICDWPSFRSPGQWRQQEGSEVRKSFWEPA